MTLSTWSPGVLAVAGERLGLEHCLRLLPGKRLAARATIEGEPVFAKVFFHDGHDRAATEEKQTMESLRAAGVRVPAPRALLLDPTCSVVLADWLPALQPLTAVLVDGWEPVLDDFLRQLRLIYDGGFLQPDLHLDNFALSGGRVWVLDAGLIEALPAGRRRRRRIARNLALLCAQAPLGLAGELRARVCDFFGVSPATILPLERRARRRRIAHARKKWLRPCSAIEVSDVEAGTRFVARDEVDPLVPRLLERPELGEPIKHGSRISVYGTDAWVVKEYRDISWKSRLKQLLGESPARRSWVAGWTLRLLGWPTPRPVAWLRHRSGRQVLVFPRLSGERYSELLTHERGHALALAPAIRDWIRLMGEAGFWHGDLKAQNILLSGDEPWFIDLDAAGWSRWRWLQRYRHGRDLQRFERNRHQFMPGNQ